jgi:translation initiation factor 1
MSKPRNTTFPPPEQSGGNNPFGALASLRGALPQGTETRPAAVPASSTAALAGKIVVRREKKGRGGKTATLVEGVSLKGAALEAFGREMRQSLGTGGGVEGDAIVISGDQVERAMAWLRARGATRLVAGN